jgi:hypothetical protein
MSIEQPNYIDWPFYGRLGDQEGESIMTAQDLR